MTSRIIHMDDVPLVSRSHGGEFECQIAPVGAHVESSKIGFNVKDGVDYWDGET